MPSHNGIQAPSISSPPAHATGAAKRARSPVEELARSLRPQMTPVDAHFSYFLIHPVAEDDHRAYFDEPVAALPSSVRALLPSAGLVLAPYMEKAAGQNGPAVVFEKPAEAKLLLSHRVETPDFATLFFTAKDEQIADYHYFFFEQIAIILSSRLPATVETIWHRLLREELSAEIHGEVDEHSWRLKQSLLRRSMAARKDGKLFRDYARQSFIDTMTLYLHGICCDIDVEAGPRQLPSRSMRKRLEALKEHFPPPADHAVFPEDVRK
jgi:hypothetical protein